MFRDLGRDRLGTIRYACYRGTNALEVSLIKLNLHYSILYIHADYLSNFRFHVTGLSSAYSRYTQKTSMQPRAYIPHNTTL